MTGRTTQQLIDAHHRRHQKTLNRLDKLEKIMPKHPCDSLTGRPTAYRSVPYRVADEAIAICRELLGMNPT